MLDVADGEDICVAGAVHAHNVAVGKSSYCYFVVDRSSSVIRYDDVGALRRDYLGGDTFGSGLADSVCKFVGCLGCRSQNV